MSQDEILEAHKARVQTLLYGEPSLTLPKAEWMAQIVDATSQVIVVMKARGLDPREYYDHRASFLGNLGRHAESIADLIAMHDPTCHNRILLRRIAVACENAGQDENALEAIDASIATKEAGAYEQEIRGRILRRLGRDSEAAKDEAAVKKYHETEAKKWSDPNHYYSHK
jgi:hypothetical protein